MRPRDYPWTTDTTATLRLLLSATTAMQGKRWKVRVPFNTLTYDQRPTQMVRAFSVKGFSVGLPSTTRLQSLTAYRNEEQPEVRKTVIGGVDLVFECDADAEDFTDIPLILFFDGAATETKPLLVVMPEIEVTEGTPWTVKGVGTIDIGCTVQELPVFAAAEFATTLEAETGTNETKHMNPARTKDAILALAPGGGSGDTVTNAGDSEDGQALVRGAGTAKEVLRLESGDNVSLTPTTNGVRISATSSGEPGGGGGTVEIQTLPFANVHGLSRLALRAEGETQLTEEFRLDDFADNAAILAGLNSRVNALEIFEGNTIAFTGMLIKIGSLWNGELTATWTQGVDVPRLQLVIGEERDLAADPAVGAYEYNEAEFEATDTPATVQAAIRANGTGPGDDDVNVTGENDTSIQSILVGGTASMSTVPELGEVDNVFDKNLNGIYLIDRPTPINEFIDYDLGEGNEKIAKGYAVYGLLLSETTVPPPINFQLLASNDGENWDLLDDKSTGSHGARSGVVLTEPQYVIANEIAYRHYRLRILETLDDVQLSEFEIWGPPVPLFSHTLRYSPAEGNIAAGTFIGTNAELETPIQGGLILASATVVQEGGNPLEAQAATIQTGDVAGSGTASASSYDSSMPWLPQSAFKPTLFPHEWRSEWDAVEPHVLGYDFGEGNAFVVTGYQLGSGSTRSWMFQGSNDGEIWTTLDTRTDEEIPQTFDGSNTYPPGEWTFANTIPYRFVQWVFTGGGMSIRDAAILAETGDGGTIGGVNGTEKRNIEAMTSPVSGYAAIYEASKLWPIRNAEGAVIGYVPMLLPEEVTLS